MTHSVGIGNLENGVEKDHWKLCNGKCAARSIQAVRVLAVVTDAYYLLTQIHPVQTAIEGHYPIFHRHLQKIVTRVFRTADLVLLG